MITDRESFEIVSKKGMVPSEVLATKVHEVHNHPFSTTAAVVPSTGTCYFLGFHTRSQSVLRRPALCSALRALLRVRRTFRVNFG